MQPVTQKKRKKEEEEEEKNPKEKFPTGLQRMTIIYR
jgi:hypothetical protein